MIVRYYVLHSAALDLVKKKVSQYTLHLKKFLPVVNI